MQDMDMERGWSSGLSPDGRVLGKMLHNERAGEGLQKNIVGNQDMKLFASGVAYFRD